jgi:hypothetical protein
VLLASPSTAEILSLLCFICQEVFAAVLSHEVVVAVEAVDVVETEVVVGVEDVAALEVV